MHRVLFLFPLWTWGPLFFTTLINATAEKALQEFNTLLKLSKSELQDLTDEFVILSPRAVMFSGLIWSLIYVFQNIMGYESFYGANGVGNVGLYSGILLGLPAYLIGSILPYYTWRLLRLVRRTLERVKSFNLFNLTPVYALSRLTALTGIAIVLMLSLTLVTFPIEMVNVSVTAVLGVQMLLAVAAFILPLRSVNQKLVAVKQGLLAEHQERVGQTLARLHQAVGAIPIKKVSEIEAALNALVVEERILRKVPTWPWRSETLREFVSALLIPMILWAVQLMLARNL